jgi:transcriptional regulator of heat shock response
MRLNYVTQQKNKAQAQIITLSNDIKQQNAAITQWKTDAALQEKHLREAEERAEKESKDHQARIDELMAKIVPARCKDAVQWGAVEAKRLAKGWPQISAATN